MQSHDLISAEAAGRLYSNIPEVVLYLYKQEKKKKKKTVLGVACRKLLLSLCFPILPSNNQENFSMENWKMKNSAHSMFWLHHQQLFTWLLQLSAQVSSFAPGEIFSTSSFPPGLSSWISAALWERFVSEKEKIIGCVCVPELLWGHRNTRWVCINQNTQVLFPNQTWQILESLGRGKGIPEVLKAAENRTQQTHENNRS